ncbi:MAG: hypothetical protein DLM59_09940, partial [Pseudonocardiales bacterium]
THADTITAIHDTIRRAESGERPSPRPGEGGRTVGAEETGTQESSAQEWHVGVGSVVRIEGPPSRPDRVTYHPLPGADPIVLYESPAATAWADLLIDLGLPADAVVEGVHGPDVEDLRGALARDYGFATDVSVDGDVTAALMLAGPGSTAWIFRGGPHRLGSVATYQGGEVHRFTPPAERPAPPRQPGEAEEVWALILGPDGRPRIPERPAPQLTAHPRTATTEGSQVQLRFTPAELEAMGVRDIVQVGGTGEIRVLPDGNPFYLSAVQGGDTLTEAVPLLAAGARRLLLVLPPSLDPESTTEVVAAALAEVAGLFAVQPDTGDDPHVAQAVAAAMFGQAVAEDNGQPRLAGQLNALGSFVHGARGADDAAIAVVHAILRPLLDPTADPAALDALRAAMAAARPELTKDGLQLLARALESRDAPAIAFETATHSLGDHSFFELSASERDAVAWLSGVDPAVVAGMLPSEVGVPEAHLSQEGLLGGLDRVRTLLRQASAITGRPSPEITLIGQALGRAGQGEHELPGDGEFVTDWAQHGLPPPLTYYKSWTASVEDNSDSPDRVVFEGDPAHPTAIYYLSGRGLVSLYQGPIHDEVADLEERALSNPAAGTDLAAALRAHLYGAGVTGSDLQQQYLALFAHYAAPAAADRIDAELRRAGPGARAIVAVGDPHEITHVAVNVGPETHWSTFLRPADRQPLWVLIIDGNGQPVGDERHNLALTVQPASGEGPVRTLRLPNLTLDPRLAAMVRDAVRLPNGDLRLILSKGPPITVTAADAAFSADPSGRETTVRTLVSPDGSRIMLAVGQARDNDHWLQMVHQVADHVVAAVAQAVEVAEVAAATAVEAAETQGEGPAEVGKPYWLQAHAAAGLGVRLVHGDADSSPAQVLVSRVNALGHFANISSLTRARAVELARDLLADDPILAHQRAELTDAGRRLVADAERGPDGPDSHPDMVFTAEQRPEFTIGRGPGVPRLDPTDVAAAAAELDKLDFGVGSDVLGVRVLSDGRTVEVLTGQGPIYLKAHVGALAARRAAPGKRPRRPLAETRVRRSLNPLKAPPGSAKNPLHVTFQQGNLNTDGVPDGVLGEVWVHEITHARQAQAAGLLSTRPYLSGTIPEGPFSCRPPHYAELNYLLRQWAMATPHSGPAMQLERRIVALASLFYRDGHLPAPLAHWLSGRLNQLGWHYLSQREGDRAVSVEAAGRLLLGLPVDATASLFPAGLTAAGNWLLTDVPGYAAAPQPGLPAAPVARLDGVAQLAGVALIQAGTGGHLVWLHGTESFVLPGGAPGQGDTFEAVLDLADRVTHEAARLVSDFRTVGQLAQIEVVAQLRAALERAKGAADLLAGDGLPARGGTATQWVVAVADSSMAPGRLIIQGDPHQPRSAWYRPHPDAEPILLYTSPAPADAPLLLTPAERAAVPRLALSVSGIAEGDQPGTYVVTFKTGRRLILSAAELAELAIGPAPLHGGETAAAVRVAELITLARGLDHLAGARDGQAGDIHPHLTDPAAQADRMELLVAVGHTIRRAEAGGPPLSDQDGLVVVDWESLDLPMPPPEHTAWIVDHPDRLGRRPLVIVTGNDPTGPQAVYLQPNSRVKPVLLYADPLTTALMAAMAAERPDGPGRPVAEWTAQLARLHLPETSLAEQVPAADAERERGALMRPLSADWEVDAALIRAGSGATALIARGDPYRLTELAVNVDGRIERTLLPTERAAPPAGSATDDVRPDGVWASILDAAGEPWPHAQPRQLPVHFSRSSSGGQTSVALPVRVGHPVREIVVLGGQHAVRVLPYGGHPFDVEFVQSRDGATENVTVTIATTGRRAMVEVSANAGPVAVDRALAGLALTFVERPHDGADPHRSQARAAAELGAVTAERDGTSQLVGALNALGRHSRGSAETLAAATELARELVSRHGRPSPAQRREELTPQAGTLLSRLVVHADGAQLPGPGQPSGPVGEPLQGPAALRWAEVLASQGLSPAAAAEEVSGALVEAGAHVLFGGHPPADVVVEVDAALVDAGGGYALVATDDPYRITHIAVYEDGQVHWRRLPAATEPPAHRTYERGRAWSLTFDRNGAAVSPERQPVLNVLNVPRLGGTSLRVELPAVPSTDMVVLP